eukprot:267011-Pleurochrysis_carterae.AAC.1
MEEAELVENVFDCMASALEQVAPSPRLPCRRLKFLPSSLFFHRALPHVAPLDPSPLTTSSLLHPLCPPCLPGSTLLAICFSPPALLRMTAPPRTSGKPLAPSLSALPAHVSSSCCSGLACMPCSCTCLEALAFCPPLCVRVAFCPSARQRLEGPRENSIG